MTSPASQFSARRAAKHAGLVVLLAMAIGVLLAAMGLFVNAEKAGEALGKELVWVGVFAFIASYGAQTGKRLLFYGASVGVLIFGAGLPAVLVLAGLRARSQPLTTEELAGFSTREGRLCNSALGVSLTAPGETFSADAEVQAAINAKLREAGGSLAAWVWTAGTGERMMVQAAKGAASRPMTFSRFIVGLRKSATEAEGVRVVSEDSAADAPPYSYRLAINKGDGLAIDISCSSSASPSPVLVLCVTTYALDHEVLKAVRESVKFGPCS